MSDTALPFIIRFDTAANRAAFTPTPGVTEQLYLWFDSDSQPDAYYWDGAAWQIFNSGSGSAPASATYLTENDETVPLPNSRQLLAGTNVAFDDTTPGERTINVTGGGTDTRVITFTVVNTSGSAIATGIAGDLYIPFSCTITEVTLLADQSGSIVIDIWKDVYANYPPTVADTITAAAKPTLSAADNSQDTTLTGWTTAITAGDSLRFNVDSATTVTRVVLALTVTVP